MSPLTHCAFLLDQAIRSALPALAVAQPFSLVQGDTRPHPHSRQTQLGVAEEEYLAKVRFPIFKHECLVIIQTSQQTRHY